MKVKMPDDEPMLKLGFPESVMRKIFTVDALPETVERSTRSESLVMCHGTFDLVHPGHLRHLAFAKQSGSRLVVSITGDEHVTKANLRPYVPEELRALNLASLELVDHVLIDRHPEPLNLIEVLKPDFFVKGYDYQGTDATKTRAEKLAVESYGGAMLFSPGDYVSSSSAIIENSPPNLSLEKLATLMMAEDLGFGDLYQAMSNIGTLSVSILGDTIVDSITRTSVIGGFRKTPTPSVRVDGHSQFVGGAGIVAKHLAAAGARVNFLTVLGNDELGKWATQDLVSGGVRVSAQILPDRPTTHKNAIVTDNHPLIRVDRVSNAPIDDSVMHMIGSQLRAVPADAVVYSDFRHGIFNRDTIPHFLSQAPSAALKVADSQVASRWGNILDFAGCDLITPNEAEVRFALADQDTVIRPLGSRLYREAGCRVLMLKLGARGMLVYRADEDVEGQKFFFALDAFAMRPVVDAVGSGDALLAYATLVYRQTGNSVIAAIIASVAAGIACEGVGNVPILSAQIVERLRALEQQLLI